MKEKRYEQKILLQTLIFTLHYIIYYIYHVISCYTRCLLFVNLSYTLLYFYLQMAKLYLHAAKSE